MSAPQVCHAVAFINNNNNNNNNINNNNDAFQLMTSVHSGFQSSGTTAAHV